MSTPVYQICSYFLFFLLTKRQNNEKLQLQLQFILGFFKIHSYNNNNNYYNNFMYMHIYQIYRAQKYKNLNTVQMYTWHCTAKSLWHISQYPMWCTRSLRKTKALTHHCCERDLPASHSWGCCRAQREFPSGWCGWLEAAGHHTVTNITSQVVR